MILLADEGVDKPIVLKLRAEGHTVLYIAESSPGIDDTKVLEQANSHGAVLITLDKDFGELVFRQGLVHSGILLLRVAGMSALARARLVTATLAEHSHELENAFTVISSDSIRIRK